MNYNTGKEIIGKAGTVLYKGGTFYSATSMSVHVAIATDLFNRGLFPVDPRKLSDDDFYKTLYANGFVRIGIVGVANYAYILGNVSRKDLQTIAEELYFSKSLTIDGTLDFSNQADSIDNGETYRIKDFVGGKEAKLLNLKGINMATFGKKAQKKNAQDNTLAMQALEILEKYCGFNQFDVTLASLTNDTVTLVFTKNSLAKLGAEQLTMSRFNNVVLNADTVTFDNIVAKQSQDAGRDLYRFFNDGDYPLRLQTKVTRYLMGKGYDINVASSIANSIVADNGRMWAYKKGNEKNEAIVFSAIAEMMNEIQPGAGDTWQEPEDNIFKTSQLIESLPPLSLWTDVAGDGIMYILNHNNLWYTISTANPLVQLNIFEGSLNGEKIYNATSGSITGCWEQANDFFQNRSKGASKNAQASNWVPDGENGFVKIVGTWKLLAYLDPDDNKWDYDVYNANGTLRACGTTFDTVEAAQEAAEMLYGQVSNDELLKAAQADNMFVTGEYYNEGSRIYKGNGYNLIVDQAYLAPGFDWYVFVDGAVDSIKSGIATTESDAVAQANAFVAGMKTAKTAQGFQTNYIVANGQKMNPIAGYRLLWEVIGGNVALEGPTGETVTVQKLNQGESLFAFYSGHDELIGTITIDGYMALQDYLVEA